MYEKTLAYMRKCMRDAAHDIEHVMRVLYLALAIAESEEGVRHSILVPACLLHDIGRDAQYADPGVDHAEAGAAMARAFLLESGCTEADADAVAAAIASHRYRNAHVPESLEAKILFDADKLDATGLVGIARTILYQGVTGQPMYNMGPGGAILDGGDEAEPFSFMREYRYKLQNLYDVFYTETARTMAQGRRPWAQAFYQGLLAQVKEGRAEGQAALDRVLE